LISDISTDTPFECIIVCELKPATRLHFESSLAQSPMPDGQGHYAWSKAHNAHIRVTSFRKMRRDAERRNQSFFDQLTLGSHRSRPSDAPPGHASVAQSMAPRLRQHTPSRSVVYATSTWLLWNGVAASES